MKVPFKGAHAEKDMILTGVRRYVTYPFSDRPLEDILQERGVTVDHSTLNRWVLTYAPQLDEVFHRRKRPVGISRRMDETYIHLPEPTPRWQRCFKSWKPPLSQRLPTEWGHLPPAACAAARGPVRPPPAALLAVRAGFCRR